jgi:hypothetical protein
MEFATSSDWSELRIQNPSAIQSVRLVKKQGNLTDFEARKDFLGIYQTLASAEALNYVSITVDFDIAVNSLDNSLPLFLEKGYIGNSVVRFYGIYEDREYLLYNVAHSTVPEKYDRNPLNFSFELKTLKDITAYAIPTGTPSPYSSCVDPELIAQINADFKTRTGVDLDNPVDEVSARFAKAISKEKSVAYDPSYREILTIAMFKVGSARVEVSGVSGMKQVVCLFGRNGLIDGTFSLVVGWIDSSGMYHQMTRAFQDNNAALGKADSYDGEQQLTWLEGLPDGTSIAPRVHTFSGLASENDIKADMDWNKENVEAVKKLLRMLGNGFFQRMSKLDWNVTDYWNAQDSSMNDMGFIPGGAWVVDWYLNFQFK